MADKIAAAQTIRQLAVLFEGMVAAANTLDECGSLENAVVEATKAKDEAVAARDAAIVERDTALAAVKVAKSNAERIISDAQSDAAMLKANAEADAAAITQSAKEQAEAVVSGAQSEAQSLTYACKLQISGLKGEISLISTEIATLESRRDAATAEADAAETRLAQAKEAIKKLMAE